MDLTRLDALTRQLLDAEAKKRGIKHPERRSRRELVSLIVRHDYDGYKGAFDWLRAKLSPPARVAPPPPAPRPRPQPTAAARRPVVAPAVAPTVSADVTDVATLTPATITPEPTHRHVSTAPRDEGAPSTRSFVEEPIRTHSMARLLAVQGHRERALVIYEELLAKNSADAALAREASALRNGHPLTFAPGELPHPHGSARETSLELLASDRIACEARGDGAMSVRWSISEAGLARARTLLGSGGELAVRLVSIRPDPARVVRSEITEHGPIQRDGEWATSLGVGSARSFAAVGLRDAERFVSIVHTRAG